MAVPRNRVSNAKKNMRRSHHAKKPKAASTCSNCSASKMPHRICPSCGHYKGRAIVASNS